MMPTPPRSGLSSRNSFDYSTKTSRRDNGLISPAKSTFSFAGEGDSIPMPLAVSNKPDMIDESQLSGPYGRGSPGDAALIAMVNKDRTSTDLSRRKSQFYSEVFAYREPNLTARDRVHRYSVITAEVKTNVIVSQPRAHPFQFASSRLTFIISRSKMSTFSCKTSPSIFRKDIRDPSPPSS